MRPDRLLALLVLGGACGGTPTASPTDGYSPPPAPATVPPGPQTSQGSAPGLCSQWSVGPVNLSMLPSSSDTASLAARSDARGGITVWIVDRAGAVTAASFQADGTVDGTPLLLGTTRPQDLASSTDAGASGDAGIDSDAGTTPPVIHDLEATPAGWLASWDGGSSAGWVSAYDPVGNVAYTVALATNAATIDLAPDGTLGINDGATVGWVPAGQTTEQIAVTYAPALAGTFNLDPGPSAAWSGGVAYVSAPDLSANIETAAPDGTTFTFPGPVPSYQSCATSYGVASAFLLPGVAGQSASVLTPCTRATTPFVLLDFASTMYPLREFTFDGSVPASAPVAAAARPGSAGVVLAWPGGLPSSSTGAALGFTEVAPTGLRGPLVPLGQMPVAPMNLVLAGSNDGTTYLTIAWNGAVRAGFVARCEGQE